MAGLLLGGSSNEIYNMLVEGTPSSLSRLSISTFSLVRYSMI